MLNLAIIPARGGSKRIPGKNIKEFLGKPIIAYSIEAALESGLFDEVMVSTDDDKIAEIAKKYGAKVPFIRSMQNSNDYANISEVIYEVLDFYESQRLYPTIVCCLFATAPFITQDIIIKSYKKIIKEGFDSSFTIQKFNYPIFRALKRNKNGTIEMFWKEYINARSQDLPEAYHDAGQLYFAKVESFRKEGTFFMKKSIGIEIPYSKAIDIDTKEDWKFAEQLYQIRNKY